MGTKFFLGYINIIHFTLYSFSVPVLLQTFFTPWKRYVWRKKTRGFDLSQTLYVAVSNIVSIIIGILLRAIVITIGLFATFIAFFLALPISAFALLVNPNSSIFDKQKLLKGKKLASDWHYGYTPTLDSYSRDLYNENSTFTFVDRVDEIKTASRILSQRESSHFFIVGEPGSGRKAIIVHLASIFPNLRFLEFDYVAFLKNRGEKEDQNGALEELFAEAEAAGNVILIIDSFEEFLPYSIVLEPFLERKGLRVIGITNPASYNKNLLTNKPLMENFSVIEIEQLDKKHIRETIVDRLKTEYKTESPSEVIDSLLSASYQLLPLEAKHQPEAAIRLLDEFMAENQARAKEGVTAQEILNQFLQARLKVPFGKLKEDEKDKLKNLENLLHMYIVAQNEAISEISKALRRKRLNLAEETKPIGSFLFVGPSGVGKTATAKALASVFFEDENRLIRIDMDRFQTPKDVDALNAELAQLIRRQPYGVLLLDEFEKAPREILNLFLTIFDEGYFIDKEQNQVLCNNLIIIATSNAGSEFIREEIVKGNKNFQKTIVDYVLREGIFTTELLNRFDAVVCYAPLTKEDLRQIVRMKLDLLNKRLQKGLGKRVEINNALIENILSEGTKEEFGAREIDRTINKLVEDKIADQLVA